uniref:Uncharacterized protein n=1 Tax=Globodera pallida TaxID=36090 RepID=A0A183BNT4_GLOPA
MTVRQLYERTLRALCRWISKVFTSISYQGCVHSGQRAIRWMSPTAQRMVQQHAPAANTDAELLELVDAEQHGESSAAVDDGNLRPKLLVPDATRTPWYAAPSGRRRTESDDNEDEGEEDEGGQKR